MGAGGASVRIYIVVAQVIHLGKLLESQVFSSRDPYTAISSSASIMNGHTTTQQLDAANGSALTAGKPLQNDSVLAPSLDQSTAAPTHDFIANGVPNGGATGTTHATAPSAGSGYADPSSVPAPASVPAAGSVSILRRTMQRLIEGLMADPTALPFRA